MSDVLIVVDMQEAAVANGRQFDLDGVIERINSLAAAVRSQNGTVIFVQHDGAPDDAWAPMSAGWQVAHRMHRDVRDVCVRKRTNDAFHDTTLDACIQELAPERVLIAGWATDFCVDGTVRSAVARGYDVVVAADCHTLDDRPHLPAPAVVTHHNWVWSELIAPGSVQVLPATAIAATLARRTISDSHRPMDQA